MKASIDSSPRRRSGGVPGALVGVVLIALVGLVVVSAGCGGGSPVGDAGTVPPVSTTAAGSDGETTSTTGAGGSTGSTTGASPSTSSGSSVTTSPSTDLVQLSVYFVSSEKVRPVHRMVPRTQGVAAAAVQELVKGPTAAEKGLDGRLSSAVPSATRLLGISVKDGVALVDLSKEFASGGGSLSMSLRLAQMVYTLTQFPTIDSVNFALDGKRISVFGGEGIILDHPVGRKDYEELTPAILVEDPTLGDRVTSPLSLRGTANVFEAVFQVELLDGNGAVLAKTRVQASSGTGTRGRFAATLRFSPATSEGRLVAFALSPKDGSRIDVVTIPVRFAR